ncbi:MAG TPA: hypothetical protein VM778_04745 [Gemmatimonadota bacterium]|nr:hypothetical protein [Gemmatimonadota bacterium]
MKRMGSVIRLRFPLVLAALLAACSSTGVPLDRGDDGDGIDLAERVPLSDLAPDRYLGFEGGLYPGGGNVPPPDHAAEGARRAALVQPLDAQGRPDPGGWIVLLSIGMSNTTQEFCGGPPPCDPWTFAGQAAVDPLVDHATVAIVDGAFGGEPAEDWESPDHENYLRILEERLAPRGLTEAQVQAVWIKQANGRPERSLPDPAADAYVLERSLGGIVRALEERYPNLQIVYLSSRTYGGYALTQLSPEPYAYETGFAVKWVVSAQIEQARTGGAIDAESGDLAYTRAPWLAWGPYLWADGTEPRDDGLRWLRSDFGLDGTHPSRAGAAKVGDLLLDFLTTAPTARCWFVVGQSCG